MGRGSGYIERDDLMSSVALWYQTEAAQTVAGIARGAGAAACSVRRSARRKQGGCDNRDTSQHRVQMQEVGGVTDGKQLWFTPVMTAVGWKSPSNNPQGAERSCGSSFCTPWDYGIYRVSPDGKRAGSNKIFTVRI